MQPEAQAPVANSEDEEEIVINIPAPSTESTMPTATVSNEERVTVRL
jgi:hypothetical protein